MEQELLRVAEAARILGIGRTKTYELVAAGAIPTVRIGRAVRVPKAALYIWIQSQTSGPTAGVAFATDAARDGRTR